MEEVDKDLEGVVKDVEDDFVPLFGDGVLDHAEDCLRDDSPHDCKHSLKVAGTQLVPQVDQVGVEELDQAVRESASTRCLQRLGEKLVDLEKWNTPQICQSF